MTVGAAAAPARARRRATVAVASAGLAIAVVTGLLVGDVDIDFADLIHVLGQKLGLNDDPERLSDSVLWAIRFPRVLSGAAVGAVLGVAGAGLQGTFRNQMADAQLVGIAPAAGLGAVAGIALTPTGGSPVIMIAGAALAGAAAAMVMGRIARHVLDASQFILVGLVLGLAALAWLGAIVLAWDSPRVPTLNFWIFGGLSGATWSTLGAGLPFLVAGSAAVALSARPLDVLALGEAAARHLGVAVDRVTAVVLLGVGVAVGAAVGIGGVVGFVGLIVPLFVRRLIGPAHRWLLPLSALGGAMMVVTVDILARTIASPIEIPVGLLTASLGGPVLVWFLLTVGRSRA